LARCGVLGENLLAVHVNYVAKGDAALLAKNKVHVVHCPRSHHYFRHAEFPLRQFLRAGVNICLGSDSLASVFKARRETVGLNMFEEMRTLADREPWLSSKKILQMATMNSAHALGIRCRVGELSPGSFADLIATPFSGTLSGAHEAVLAHKGDVTVCMIDGQWTRGARVRQTEIGV